MGTNYYAQIIPSANQINTLKDYIDKNEVENIKNTIDVLYNKIDEYSDEPHNIVHLGKNCGGWVFLWNPNIVFSVEYNKSNDVYKPKIKFCTFGKLDHKHIYDFIFRDDVKIYNEYDDVVNKYAFWKMTTEQMEKDKLYPHLLDGEAYRKNKNNDWYRRSTPTNYEKNLMTFFGPFDINNGDFYSDGMRFSTTLEFS